MPDQIARPRVDFARVNRAALARYDDILRRWLPGGRFEGPEYVVRNPRRLDHRPGSCKINSRTGKWGDFAAGVGGGDPISLAAYLFDLSQLEAAKRLARMLGVDDG
jgi:hypothetical protein